MMSRYTTELRYICESLAGLEKSSGYKNVDEVIEKSRAKIFPPFEIFDESYRPVLETKILKHFYTREIGFETFGLWQLKLDAKLSVIIPYYNRIYKAINLDVPIIENVNMYSEHDTGRNSDTSSTDTSGVTTASTISASQTGATKNRHSDTPQGSLEDLENNVYMSDATLVDSEMSNSNSTKSESDSKSNSSTVAKTTEEYAEHRWGKEGSITYISMVTEYIEKIKNVDAMLIHELEDLFMGVWDIYE